MIHYGLSEDTESLKCLRGAEKDSFHTCPPDPYSQRAPQERDLLGLECLARLLRLLNMTGNMESICCVWPHFPLGFVAQKPEYSCRAHKSNLDALCAAGTPESTDFCRKPRLLCCADKHTREFQNCSPGRCLCLALISGWASPPLTRTDANEAAGERQFPWGNCWGVFPANRNSKGLF